MQWVQAHGKQEDGWSVHKRVDEEGPAYEVLCIERESLFGGLWYHGLFGKQRIGFGKHVD